MAIAKITILTSALALRGDVAVGGMPKGHRADNKALFICNKRFCDEGQIMKNFGLIPRLSLVMQILGFRFNPKSKI